MRYRPPNPTHAPSEPWSNRHAPSAIALLAVCCALLSACGNEARTTTPAAPATVRTATPERTFAPLVLLDARERRRPISARWFIENAVLWFADGGSCPDRKIAVGRALPEQRSPRPTADVDWIYLYALGEGELAYYRNPYDAGCELDFDVRYLANQLTRPHDPSPLRPSGLRPGGGFHLDLDDDARDGRDGALAAPVYTERRDEGDGRVRLTYWMLFGVSDPGRGAAGRVHEGDWERIDVLLDHDGDDGYAPLALELGAGTAAPRQTAWGRIARSGRRPLARLARGSHKPVPMRPGGGCADCARWRTWEDLRAASAHRWYGFGGAWGEPGPSDATTGALGPHGHWPASTN